MSDYIPFSENTVPIGPSCSLQALGYKQEGKGNKNVVHLQEFFCTILVTTSFKKYIKKRRKKENPKDSCTLKRQQKWMMIRKMV